MTVKSAQLQALGECLTKHLPDLPPENINQHRSELLAAYSNGADFEYLIRNDKSAADDIANLRKAENHIQLALKFLGRVGFLGNVSFDKQLSAEMKELLGINWRTSATQSIDKLLELLQPINQTISDASKLNEANSVGIVFSLTLALVACGSPENREAWRAIGQASCSMSINCDPSSYARGGTSYESSPRDANSPANSGNTSANPWDNGNGLLDRRTGWRRVNGKVMCYYSDGSVINAGGGICPSSI